MTRICVSRKVIQPGVKVLGPAITAIIQVQDGAQDTGAVAPGNTMSKHHKNTGGIHRKVWESVNGKIPKGHHIHHIDGNPYNNELSNLTCVTAEEHGKLHGSQFASWASIGGKIGGDKCKHQGLGWFHATPEERKQRSEYALTHRRFDLDSERRKDEYACGVRTHWSTYYTPEEVSQKISKGDPGKSTRGKIAWNNGKKMALKNPELARERKRKSALFRKKIKCNCCNKEFDPGGYTRHINAKKNKL